MATLLVDIVFKIEADMSVHNGLLGQILELKLDSEDWSDSLVLLAKLLVVDKFFER